MSCIRNPKRVAIATLAGVVGLSLLGCSAHAPGSGLPQLSDRAPSEADAAAEDQALARIRVAERHERGAAQYRRALEAQVELENAWDEGQARWLEGDHEAAFDTFDEGVGRVLAAGLDLDRHPDLRDHLAAVMDSIHELAVNEAAMEELEGALDAPHVAPVLDSVVAAVPSAPSRVSTTPDWLAAVTGDYEIPDHQDSSVDAMVRFYSGKGRKHFETGLQRCGKYGPLVTKIFEEEGVPMDLFWLALVESNFNAQAYSHAKAKGLWQFIPGTGKNYGLDIDFWVDERADFEKATRSSARYMKFLHDKFGDWHLALAAYNAGEGKVGRGIRRTGRKDYWHLRQTRNLRRETKSYVPAFIAVMRIVRDPEKYGVTFAPAPPLSWDRVEVTSCTDLKVVAECAGTTEAVIKDLNPELRKGCTPGGNRSYSLRVPHGKSADFVTAYAALPPEKRLDWQQHTVRRGENLSLIARAHGSSVGAIMAANNIKSANRISVGWNLLIPRGDGVHGLSAATIASSKPRGTSRSSNRTTEVYRVRSGDTLTKIAKRNGTSVQQLARLNKLGNANNLKPGQKLIITSNRASTSSGSSTYRVRSGDTLSGIAKKHRVSVAQLRGWNGLSSKSYIHPGQRLAVKGSAAKSTQQKQSYAVKSGDTLSDIARTFKTTVAKLREWNSLSRNGYIHPGDRLTIIK